MCLPPKREISGRSGAKDQDEEQHQKQKRAADEEHEEQQQKLRRKQWWKRQSSSNFFCSSFHPHCEGTAHCSGTLPFPLYIMADVVAKSRKRWDKWAMCRGEGCTRRVSPERQDFGSEFCCSYCEDPRRGEHGYYCIPPGIFVEKQQQKQKRAGEEEHEE